MSLGQVDFISSSYGFYENGFYENICNRNNYNQIADRKWSPEKEFSSIQKINDLMPNWESRIQKSITCSEIISIFKNMNMEKIADRLSFLNNLVHEDPNEFKMVFESLKEMALFLTSQQFRKPMIGLTSKGFIQIQWHIDSKGLLVMTFLDTGIIKYSAIHPEDYEGAIRKRIRGISSRKDITQKISSLISLLKD